MEYIETADAPDYGGQDKATAILKKYKEAKNIKDYWKDRFEGRAPLSEDT